MEKIGPTPIQSQHNVLFYFTYLTWYSKKQTLRSETSGGWPGPEPVGTRNCALILVGRKLPHKTLRITRVSQHSTTPSRSASLFHGNSLLGCTSNKWPILLVLGSTQGKLSEGLVAGLPPLSRGFREKCSDMSSTVSTVSISMKIIKIVNCTVRAFILLF